jgi:diacylglycerol O-acyltransferase
MTYAHSERLSALDLSFLAMEDGRAHMHIGSVSIFDAAPLRRDDGGLDFERLLEFVEAQLHKVPRLREKLAWVPGFGHPVWVDDEHFNIRFHVRHTALPAPGDVRLLKRLAGRILSQEFDRGKPLWEDWFVDGLEGNRFALISKTHHSMADGISGVAMGKLLVGPDPAYRPAPRKDWIPRPAPSATRLVLDELRHRVSTPFELGRSIQRESGAAGGAASGPSLRTGFRSLLESATHALSGGSPTPLNVEVGPHRRFDWARLPLADVRAIGASAGAKVNDVALAIASGALRSFLRARGVEIAGLDFRAVVPVSVRQQAERGALGNRVSQLIAPLPLDEADPWKRLLRVVETTRELKTSGQSSAGEVMTTVIDLLPTQLAAALYRRASSSGAANLIITNVPGPRVPVYLLGARQLEAYPVVPLLANQALGIALLSYDGGLYWGFNSDWDALPDLHGLVEDILAGFEELREIAAPARPETPDAAAAPSREQSA